MTTSNATDAHKSAKAVEGSLTEGLVGLVRAKSISRDDLDAAALFTLDAVANILAGRNSAPGKILLNWWNARTASNSAPDPERRAKRLRSHHHLRRPFHRAHSAEQFL